MLQSEDTFGSGTDSEESMEEGERFGDDGDLEQGGEVVKEVEYAAS